MKKRVGKFAIVLLVLIATLTGCSQGVLGPEVAAEENAAKGFSIIAFQTSKDKVQLFVPAGLTQVRARHADYPEGPGTWMPIYTSGSIRYISTGPLFSPVSRYNKVILDAWYNGDYASTTITVDRDYPSSPW